MKRLSLSAFAFAGLMFMSAPAFAEDAASTAEHHHARHHHHHAHGKKGKKKCKMMHSKTAQTEDLNAASLQGVKRPVAPAASVMPPNMPTAPAEMPAN